MKGLALGGNVWLGPLGTAGSCLYLKCWDFICDSLHEFCFNGVYLDDRVFRCLFNFVPEATCRDGQRGWGPVGEEGSRPPWLHGPAPAQEPQQVCSFSWAGSQPGSQSAVELRPGGSGPWGSAQPQGSLSFATRGMLGERHPATCIPSSRLGFLNLFFFFGGGGFLQKVFMERKGLILLL